MNDSTSGEGSGEEFTPADNLGGILPGTAPVAPVDGPGSQFPATYKKRLGVTGEGAERGTGDASLGDHAPTHYEALRSSGKTKWLIGLGVVAILAISGLLALSIGTSSGALQTARTFMGHLDDGEYTEAVALTDPSCTGGANEAALANIFKGVDIDFELTRSEVNATGSTLVDGTVTVDGLGQQPLNLSLRKVEGDWRVCSIN